MYLYDEIPVSCGSKWDLLTVDFDEVDGRTKLFYRCGDVCEDEPMPERRQIAWWMRYWRSVMESGDDPLNQVYKEWTVTLNNIWQVAFYQSALRGVGVRARKNRRGEWIQGRLLPEYMRLYFCLEGAIERKAHSNYAEKEDYSTIEELASLAAKEDTLLYWSNRSPYTLPGANVWGLFRVPHEEKRSYSTTKIKSIARKAYRKEKERHANYEPTRLGDI